MRLKTVLDVRALANFLRTECRDAACAALGVEGLEKVYDDMASQTRAFEHIRDLIDIELKKKEPKTHYHNHMNRTDGERLQDEELQDKIRRTKNFILSDFTEEQLQAEIDDRRLLQPYSSRK